MTRRVLCVAYGLAGLYAASELANPLMIRLRRLLGTRTGPSSSPTRIQGAKNSIVIALSTNCPFCVRSVPAIGEIIKSSASLNLSNNPSISLLFSEDFAESREFLASIPKSKPVETRFGVSLKSMGIYGVPALFVVGADDRVTFSHQGEIRQPDIPKIMQAARSWLGKSSNNG
jgi:hypothetical protein